MTTATVYNGFFRADADEWPWSLNKPEYRTKLVRDFPDAFITNLVDDERSEYDLQWVGYTNRFELRSLMEDAGGEFGYNYFDLETLLDALDRYSIDDGFYFGREGSPVLYIAIAPEIAAQIGRLTKADESDPDGSGFYRLWWD